MAITLDIRTGVEQLDNGATIRLIDVTGVADGTNYPDGWGDAAGLYATNNPRQSEATAALIEIEFGDINYSSNLTGTDLSDFMNPMIGKNFSVTDVLGSGYEYFEDGIYRISVTFSGTNVQGVPTVWSENNELHEAFLWAIKNSVRQMLAEIEVPIKNYAEAFSAGLLTAMFVDIYYLCQFGQADKAQEVIDYLTSVLSTQTNLTELFKNFNNYE